MKRVVFRTDSSIVIGSGHLMRCLTLADCLRNRGTEVSFICRNLPGNLSRRVLDNKFELKLLPYTPLKAELRDDIFEYNSLIEIDPDQDIKDTERIIQIIGDVEWLIVDHYGLDRMWEWTMRRQVRYLMVIDDLANRFHDCDIILDQNLCKGIESRYDYKVPDYCRKLLGPCYALLRPEFEAARRILKPRSGIIKRILIFFGASDLSNETAKALTAIKQLARDDLHIDVVLGGAYCHREAIMELKKSMSHVIVHDQVSNMAELMLTADLAIGAGGTTTLERCYLGLPTIAIIIADNQQPATEELADRGALWNAGFCEHVAVDRLANMIRFALDHPDIVQSQCRTALEIFGNDNTSGREKVADVMMEVAHARPH